MNELLTELNTKPEDTKPEDTKPEDTKLKDTKPEDTKPEDAKPEDAKPEDAKPEDAKLKDEQLEAFNKYINKENIFISGPGGTGKTYLIQCIVKHAKSQYRIIKVCALTGCAAVLLECGATTLHTFAGIGLATGSINEIVNRVVKSWPKRSNWLRTELLIIDEVSMLSMKLLIILDKIGRIIKKKNVPFGGMQLIFSGDFYQLPPIGNSNDPDSCKFCFECPLWSELFPKPILLKTIYRQTDMNYIKILNNIRVGRISRASYEYLQKCIDREYTEDIYATLILPRRIDVDKINNKELDKLEGEPNIYKSKNVAIDEQKLTLKEKKMFENISQGEKTRESTYLKTNIMAKETLVLKVGTLVMCVANLDLEGPNPIVNGSQGIVIDFIRDLPRVKFNNGDIRLIDRHIWRSERILGIAISQIPLIYGWAITIHKAQGLSLDKGILDLGRGIFECGQTYVALSRIRSLDGLYLKAFDINKITVNRKVLNYYASLKSSVLD